VLTVVSFRKSDPSTRTRGLRSRCTKVPVVDLEADDASTTPPSRKHVLLGDDVRRVNDGELPSIFAVETPFFDSSARSINVYN